jgi:hypothetical protein
MCNTARARAEITGCRNALMERFGLPVVALAYPNGDSASGKLDWLAKLVISVH